MIDDGTSVDLPASLQSKGLNIGTKFPMPYVDSEEWFVGVDLGVYFQAAKSHALHSSAFRSKNKIYGIYKKTDDFIIVAGAEFRPDYEDQSVLPFVGFKYVVNDQWQFNFLSNQPYIAYQMNERTTWKLNLGGYLDEFEVMNGGRKGDIVKIREFHIGLGLDYKITDDIQFQPCIGWALGRQYEYLKNGGKVVPEDSLFVGYKVKIIF